VIPDVVRQRRRTRQDAAQAKDKFNLSNDHYYEVSKDGRHRIRQTFGQLNVEHAYPAQKLQLPFVSTDNLAPLQYLVIYIPPNSQYKTRLSKQEARSFHRPALQFPLNVELRFTKVRTAKKKKDRAGRNLGKGGNVAEGLHTTSDLSLRDTSNFVLWEFSVCFPKWQASLYFNSWYHYRKNTRPSSRTSGWAAFW
jgi:transcription initiation factor TFIID subunit 1, fungi type